MNELAPYIKMINSIVYVNKIELAPYIKMINSIGYVNKIYE